MRPPSYSNWPGSAWIGLDMKTTPHAHVRTYLQRTEVLLDGRIPP